MDQPKKPRIMRGPDDGNLLWKLYSELGATRKREFRDLMPAADFHYNQFVNDSMASRALRYIPVYRAAVYAAFFGDDFVWQKPATGGRRAPTTATQQYHENEGR